MINDRLALAPLKPPASGAAAVEWRVAVAPVGYAEAVEFMEKRAAAIAAGTAAELVWLVEHPPLFTAGSSARGEDLVGTERFPVHATGRGGRLTYHGPGQRVAYAMLDLKRRGADVRRYVLALEEWIIEALARFDVKGERRGDRIGVWVKRPDKGEGYEDKIAALGIRVKRWVTLHGISLNVAPDLTHYAGILPCGVSEQKWGVTSLKDLGIEASMGNVDAALRASFEEIFGPVQVADEAHAPV
ncbi:MAG TPA: lipoyl(octanoyl) transferase LipB [Xanthobacteraceae bacterium]|nr:lipoyl(octanoyl) transferase LipB [Xanthobacteraceae bacterium]